MTSSQNPALCMQSDICYYNSAAMIKIVLEFKRHRTLRGRLHYLWVTYRNVLEGKTLSIFQLIICAVFSLLYIDLSLKNLYKHGFYVGVRYWRESGGTWAFSFLIPCFPLEGGPTACDGRNHNVLQFCFSFLSPHVYKRVLLLLQLQRHADLRLHTNCAVLPLFMRTQNVQVTNTYSPEDIVSHHLWLSNLLSHK